MIHVTGQLICATAEDAALVAALLPSHIRLSRAEAGCLTFNVTRSADPLIWHLDETFTDRAAFKAHQARTRTSAWFAATAHIARDFQLSDSGPGQDAE